MTYSDRISELNETIAANGAPWGAIDAESAARMVVQNRFRTGLDIDRGDAHRIADGLELEDDLAARGRIALRAHPAIPETRTRACLA